jgi:hypothetical protein
MCGAKHIALRRPQSRLFLGSAWLPLSAAVLLALALPAPAQHPLLPPREQEAVNDAVARGVAYLQRTQLKSGTWAKIGVGHRIGYAVLPGLTLLECGVPPSDPNIQQAAHYLRVRSAKLDTTYDLALGILFLDRLGDPQDKKIIQMFALRLIAGQSMTGGWGYKCPLLSPTAQQELLNVLRHLDPLPPKDMPEIAGKPGGMPGIAGNPGGMPGLAGKPGDMPGIARGPDGLPGIAGGPGKNPADLSSITSSPGSSLSEGLAGQSGSSSLSGSLAGGSHNDSLSPRGLFPDPPSRWRDCLGLGLLERRVPDPLEPDPREQVGRKESPAKAEDRAQRGPPKPDKPFVIPERLQMLTVVQDPAMHILQDPKGKRDDLVVTTTDNSNTQFAMLGLWAAQRYDVPMRRTLNLIVRRFLTSQNLNGSWNYHYSFGGALQHESFSSPGAMTCVGLIGLAVGHGLAQPLPAGQAVQDPRILKGLTALYQMVGKPSDFLIKQPMQNLYYLWSLERVAVLYRLPALGDKDWYRWGAQVLVTNQLDEGSWVGGQYPGNSEILDTCLALLFLKRANLAKDLTEKLPFKAADLNNSIMEKLMPSSPESVNKTPEVPEPPKETRPSVEPPRQQAPENRLTQPVSSLPGTATEGESSGGKKKWIVLTLIILALLAGGGSILIFLIAKRKQEKDEEKNGKAKKRKNKRKLQSTT